MQKIFAILCLVVFGLEVADLRFFWFRYEGGLWNNWPGIPAPVLWVLNNTVARWNGRWWRFASCDSSGQLKELPALGE